MNPGDLVTLHPAVKPVTVLRVEGDRFWYLISPNGREIEARLSDIIEPPSDGPVGVAILKQLPEAEGD
ncbi:hypothetical protein UFOVP407_24 [uncultured Caudovirales phage]|uniref:Uncharacterized protein n=1 Tax=uncultured Caudovirales phage TaxID=2100421 RepID=A0A6J5M1H7_9CAUD|nr:hypothetical protein UFOVP407_24 [uncultured Caudovirales phage]